MTPTDKKSIKWSRISEMKRFIADNKTISGIFIAAVEEKQIIISIILRYLIIPCFSSSILQIELLKPISYLLNWKSIQE